ncbi:MAG: hypothetical protein J6C97_04380, partial [Clostridia bacterium]|nr:hypothetical protein [Clostridia bacterium]
MADNKNFMKELSELLNSKKLEETIKEVSSFKRAIISLNKALDKLQKDITNKANAPLEPEEVKVEETPKSIKKVKEPKVEVVEEPIIEVVEEVVVKEEPTTIEVVQE